MNFFTKSGQKRYKAGKIFKEELKFYQKKTLHVVKFTPKSMISSKGNGSEKQNLQYTLII